MTDQEIERRLGLRTGPTLTQLAKKACELAPRDPGYAFDALQFQLPWLSRQFDYPSTFAGCGTPKDVHAFAFTGGDLVHFGFLMSSALTTDECPVVCVDPGDAAHIVAPDLRSFLGLLSIAYGGVIGRHTNERWFSFRQTAYGDQPEHLMKMERLSRVLLSIPGVVRPEDPQSVASAVPDRAFELT